MTDRGHTKATSTVPSTVAAGGAPCWVSLTARDLDAAERFYGGALGWQFRPTSLGEEFRIALSAGRPVAGLGAVASAMQVAVVWTPFFAVAQVDEAAARIRERSATVAFGPLGFAAGRAVVAADRDGAVFGVWEGRLRSDWQMWQETGGVVLRLRTRDAFEAAIFYGQVLRWAEPRADSCQVSYENDEVVVRKGARTVARLGPGAVPAAPDPALRPRWEVQFAVPDVEACVVAARDLGGTVVERAVVRGVAQAALRDPDGGMFTVSSEPWPP